MALKKKKDPDNGTLYVGMEAVVGTQHSILVTHMVDDAATAA